MEQLVKKCYVLRYLHEFSLEYPVRYTFKLYNEVLRTMGCKYIVQEEFVRRNLRSAGKHKGNLFLELQMLVSKG